MKAAWLGAIAILLASLINELLPVVFGAGEHARLDWGFTYVTLRFVLLPLACASHVGAIAAMTVRGFRRGEFKAAAAIALSSAISLGYLLASFLWPVPWLDF